MLAKPEAVKVKFVPAQTGLAGAADKAPIVGHKLQFPGPNKA